MTKIGLLGCGAIGSEIATAVCDRKVGNASLVALFDQDAEMASSLARRLPITVPAFTNIGQFLAVSGLEMVVECASPGAVRAYAEAVLSSGRDLLMISSGALTDTALFHRLAALAEGRGRRLIIPSGALGGIDAIRAARGRLEEVTLTTTKPPEALKGAPGFKEWESKEIIEAQVIFDGSALDPRSPGNVHEIYARGDFGVMRFTLENRPHERNPRTSYLAVLSVLETLREACTPGPRIGT